MTTACADFDHLLEGGLERGTMVELIGRRSSGRFSLALTALAAATQAGEAAALIDLGDALDPQAAAAAGVELERLLWVRPRHIKEVLACAEVTLSSGIPLVVIDTGMPPVPGGRGNEASWLRLARAARSQRTALLISSPYRMSGTAARNVLEMGGSRAAWLGQGPSPRLLRGITTHLELVKSHKPRRQGETAPLAWRLAEDLMGDLPMPTRGALGRRDASSPNTTSDRSNVVRFRERAIA
ncbi:MAG: hypothetical protein AAF560_15060 [Acidobacteriota bacterium]